jgi:hypothetical protein
MKNDPQDITFRSRLPPLISTVFPLWEVVSTRSRLGREGTGSKRRSEEEREERRGKGSSKLGGSPLRHLRPLKVTKIKPHNLNRNQTQFVYNVESSNVKLISFSAPKTIIIKNCYHRTTTTPPAVTSSGPINKGLILPRRQGPWAHGAGCRKGK